MSNGYDPASFDIVREEYRDRDDRDYRDDRNQQREQERERRQEDRESAPSPSMSQSVQDAMETIVNTDSVVLDSEMVRAINDPSIRMTRNGDLSRLLRREFSRANLIGRSMPKKRRRTSKYSRAYKAAFRKCKSRHVKKDGTWKKGGFKRCVAESHKMAKKKA